MDIPFSIVDLVNNLQFNKECELVLIADVRKFQDYIIELDRKYYTVLDSSGTKRGQIQYNVEEGEDLCEE